MNEARPDLNLLVVFDAVARCRSVSKAAVQLSLSQPAVSHALNRLRDLTGDRLFVRGRAGFTPTPRAEAMIAPVRDLLATAGRVVYEAPFDPGTSRRRFRIAGTDYSNLSLLPRLAADLRRLAPHCTLDVVPVGSSTLADLEAGELDCTFWGASPPPSPWCSCVLFSDAFIGLVAETHPLGSPRAGEAVSLDDYLAHPHVVVSLGDPGSSPIDVTLARQSRARHVAIRTQSFISNVSALIGTDLVTSMPARLLPILAPRGFRSFEIPLALPPIEYGLVWHRRCDGDPSNLWLRQTIEESCARA
jgi:DNA-binding transcriptional LysR family regulator